MVEIGKSITKSPVGEKHKSYQLAKSHNAKIKTKNTKPKNTYIRRLGNQEKFVEIGKSIVKSRVEMLKLKFMCSVEHIVVTI